MILPKTDSIPLIIVALATVIGLYFTLAGDYVGVSAEPIYVFENPQEEQLFALMTEEFGGFMEPRMSGDWALDSLAEGRAAYEVQCMHCHGTDGRANTPTAKLLTPPPRDFGLGVVKFTSTPVGLPATRADLHRTIVEGVPSTSMSRFGGLPAEHLELLTNYAMYLLVRGAVWTDAMERLNDAASATAATPDGSTGGNDNASADVVPALTATEAFTQAMTRQRQQFALAIASWARPEIPAVADSARGRELYFSKELGCMICHKKDGSGGLINTDDIWGAPMVARDLQKGVLRGGDSPADVYLRIRNGVKGTMMPPMAESIEPSQIWDMVAFVRSVQESE